MKNKLLLFLSLMLITLPNAWGQSTWTKINNHTDVTSSGIYMIVDVTSERALTSANGTDSAPSAVPVNITGGNTIIGNIADELQWTFQSSGANYIISPKGEITNLYAENTNNGVRIGTDSKNKWRLGHTSGAYKGFVNTTTNKDRYLGVYNNQDWRTYESVHTNIENTQIEIFELQEVSTDPSLSVSPTEITGLGYEVGSSTSTAQTFTLSGTNLDGSEDVDILPGDNWEVSINDTDWFGYNDDGITLSNYNGSSTPIYVRLKIGLAEGVYNDPSNDLILIEGYDTSAEVTLSGTVTGEIPCGGLETFDNATDLPTGTTYGDESFVGNDGITWNYVHAMSPLNAGNPSSNYSINGQGILLRRSNEPSSISATIQGGIGNFSVDTRKAFTGNTQRKLELVINGNVIEQFQPSFSNNADDTIIPFVVNDINIAGEFTLELRLFGVDGNQQITLDNISWTCYELADFTWNGSVDTSWEEEENWTPNGTPTEDDSAWIPAGMPHYPAITGTALADKITVEEDASVKILEGGSLTVTNEMVNLGTAANFVVESGANLVQINDEAENTGDITVQGEFNFTEGRQQYNFTMSPVEGQDIRQIFGDGNTIPFALVYNEKTDYFVVPQTAEYANKNGFAIKEVEGSGTATMTANYVGGISNGEFSFPLKKEGQGFNVLGNPYPSNLDLYKLYTDNSDKIESTFFFWDNINNTNYEQEGSGYNGSNYASFNAASGTNGSGKAAPCKDCGAVKIPTKNIKVGTGFMIQAKEEGTLNYKNEYRTTENDGPNFFGKSNTETVEDDRYWLTLKKPNGISVMNVVVYFEGGKNEYAADDSQAFGSSDELYSWIEGYQLGIQGKSPFVVNDTIALGYRAFEAGEYQIDIFKQEGVFGNGTTIYLVDQDLDMVHNLSEGTYHFKTEAGEFNERFLIIYEEDEVLNTIDFANADIQVYRQDKTTVIRSLAKDLSELKIYNLNGQLLLHEDQLSGKYYHLPEGRLGKQVLLLNVKTADGKVHSFKILTY